MNPTQIAQLLSEDINFNAGMIVEGAFFKYKGNDYRLGNSTPEGRALLTKDYKQIGIIKPNGQVQELEPITPANGWKLDMEPIDGEVAQKEREAKEAEKAARGLSPIHQTKIIGGYEITYKSEDGTVQVERFEGKTMQQLKPYIDSLKIAGYIVKIETLYKPGWDSPVYRAEHAADLRKKWGDSDTQKLSHDAIRRYWNQPDKKAEALAKLKEVMDDDQGRELMDKDTTSEDFWTELAKLPPKKQELVLMAIRYREISESDVV